MEAKEKQVSQTPQSGRKSYRQHAQNPRADSHPRHKPQQAETEKKSRSLATLARGSADGNACRVT
jgi:hypothetical protein